MAECKYRSAKSQKIMEQIAAEAARKPIDYQAVMAFTGLSASGARGYLQHMAIGRQIHLCESIGLMRLYSIGPRPTGEALDNFANDALRKSENPHIQPGWRPHPDPVATAWMRS